MNRIDKKFQELKKGRKKAFIAFITAGYPNLEITRKLILEFTKIGVDVLELGVPFSDPMADGPIIQEASGAALKRKTHLFEILKLVRQVRRDTDIPICLMTYYNPIFCFGEAGFVKSAKKSGVDGVIIPDLPPEEGRPFMHLANKYNLDVICFISPTTLPGRIKFIGRISKGFIYYVSLTGVTGPRANIPLDLKRNIREIKKYTRKPVCVGFGVANNFQVKQIYSVADGVIVGSAIVRKIKENINKPDLIKRVSKFVRGLRT